MGLVVDNGSGMCKAALLAMMLHALFFPR